MSTPAIVEHLLARLDPAEVDRPVPLLSNTAAKFVETIIGKRPHRSAMHRMEAKGSRGIKLQVLRYSRERFVTARALVEFFVACGAASPPARGRRGGRS